MSLKVATTQRRIRRSLAAAAVLVLNLATGFPQSTLSVSAAISRPTGASVLKTGLTGDSQKMVGEYATMGGKAYFAADNGTNGNELWVTDGTTAGTVMLKDIKSGSASSMPYLFYSLGSKVIFVADDGTHGEELWVTDGTAGGTVLLADIYSGSTSSIPGSGSVNDGSGNAGDGFSVIGNKAYFAATSSTAGREPWVTDGTAGGTVMLADVRTGTANSMGSGPFIAVGSNVLFAANNGTNGTEPHIWNGTSVTMLTDLASGSTAGIQGWLVGVSMGNVAYFEGSPSGTYGQIWVTDGTAGGTSVAIPDLDAEASGWTTIRKFGNRLIINGQRFTTSSGLVYDSPSRLWISDGTAGGTTLISRVNPTGNADIYLMKQLGSRYLFVADDGTSGSELWATDGTPAGTQMLIDANPGSGGGFGGIPEVNRLFVNDSETFGVVSMVTGSTMTGSTYGMFATDGTPGGTSQFQGDLDRPKRPMPAGDYVAFLSQWGWTGEGLLVSAPGTDSQLTNFSAAGRKTPTTYPPLSTTFATPSFSASITSYSINLTDGRNSVNIQATTSDGPGAPTCLIEGVACSGGSMGIHTFAITAPRLITVVVTAQNGTSTTYTLSVSLNGVAPTTTTTAAPTTTVAPTTTATPASTTTPSTSTSTSTSTATASANPYLTSKAGITVTDAKVYTKPPAEVAADSAIRVLTPAQDKVLDVETKTPAVCLPNEDDLVFIDEGKCIAEVVNARTRKLLRTLRTTVIADDISDVKVGNEIVTLAPIYFDVMSTKLDAKAMGRLRSLKARISAAGSVLLIGHSGTLNGNSPANVAVSKARAESTLAALKSIGAQGPFATAGVGALDPASNGKTEADQAKNRRVVVVLIP